MAIRRSLRRQEIHKERGKVVLWSVLVVGETQGSSVHASFEEDSCDFSGGIGSGASSAVRERDKSRASRSIIVSLCSDKSFEKSAATAGLAAELKKTASR